MKGSATARHALEANLLIEWVDPLYDGAEPCFHHAYARDIAATRRRAEPRYESDEAALEDFLIVHWATIPDRYNQMTLPQIAARESLRKIIKYPNEKHWNLDLYPTLDEAILAAIENRDMSIGDGAVEVKDGA
jgi:hypothetical protein